MGVGGTVAQSHICSSAPDGPSCILAHGSKPLYVSYSKGTPEGTALKPGAPPPPHISTKAVYTELQKQSELRDLLGGSGDIVVGIV